MKKERVTEAYLEKENFVLIVLSTLEDEYLSENFFGSVIFLDELSNDKNLDLGGKNVYLCGDLEKAYHLDLSTSKQVLIIEKLSILNEGSKYFWPTVSLGQVPINVGGMGVLYRRFFDVHENNFERICEEHEFQSLTESTKSEKAHRKGIYLTPIKRDENGLNFRLLRCSTNLSGPTENFRSTDKYIVDALNLEANNIFEKHASLNHVLAQVYNNTVSTDNKKQAKAKISSHADKTKDMPLNGIMAFCTFYDQLDKLEQMSHDEFDYGYKKSSGMTKLKFCLKGDSEKETETSLPKEFFVTLYPGSVFFMPLSTNRLYTHEIKPSVLDAEMLPTRLGYVVRCSSTEACYTNSQTFLKINEELKPLESPTLQGMDDLRRLYADENKSDSFIDYKGKFLFSMNEGDYKKPIYHAEDEFNRYFLNSKNDIFEELYSSICFEETGKGRVGAVLVSPDDKRGIPIVRTTTKYGCPAQKFKKIHLDLATQIMNRASLKHDLNNVLIESYTDKYASMGAHSDQSQDLDKGSVIAIYSCYKYPDLKPTRKLVVESKEFNDEVFEIELKHNSVVVFTLDTNQRFKHKIVLESKGQQAENQWLGMTFRTSKTFVRYEKDQVNFENGDAFYLASEEESRNIYTLRKQENAELEFVYPWLTCTLSESDLMLPKSLY